METLKNNDAINQAVGVTFNSKIENGKLIINALNITDLVEYHVEMPPNPYIDF